MIAAILVMQSLLIIGLLVILRQQRMLERRISDRLHVIEHSMLSRQSKIKMARQSIRSPEVDFRPTTTRRDTDDIPRTGRGIRPRNIVRKGGDLHGDYNDGGLQVHTGTPPAQVGEATRQDSDRPETGYRRR